MKLPWYRWEPGSVPYLERISLEARGYLWRWMDDHWMGFPVDPSECPEARSSWECIKPFLDSQRSSAEENAKVKHFNAVNANRIRWGSKKDPGRIQEVEVEVEVEKEQKEKEKDSCPEPKTPDQSPIRYEVPCVGSKVKTWSLREGKFLEWVESFPGVNVDLEVKKAIQWIRDNPTRAKTAAGTPAFFSRWLGKAQDSTKTPSNGGTNGKPHHRSETDGKYITQIAESAGYKPDQGSENVLEL